MNLANGASARTLAGLLNQNYCSILAEELGVSASQRKPFTPDWCLRGDGKHRATLAMLEPRHVTPYELWESTSRAGFPAAIPTTPGGLRRLRDSIADARVPLLRRLHRISHTLTTKSGRALKVHLDADLGLGAVADLKSKVPGIAVGPALVLLAWRESALAFVLAHEAAHLSLGHRPREVMAVLSASIRDWPSLPPIDPMGFGWLVTELVLESALTAERRKMEREADCAGARLAVDAGYSPTAGLGLLVQLDEIEKRLGAWKLRVPFLLAHPSYTARTQHIAECLGLNEHQLKAAERDAVLFIGRLEESGGVPGRDQLMVKILESIRSSDEIDRDKPGSVVRDAGIALPPRNSVDPGLRRIAKDAAVAFMGLGRYAQVEIPLAIYEGRLKTTELRLARLRLGGNGDAEAILSVIDAVIGYHHAALEIRRIEMAFVGGRDREARSAAAKRMPYFSDSVVPELVNRNPLLVRSLGAPPKPSRRGEKAGHWNPDRAMRLLWEQARLLTSELAAWAHGKNGPPATAVESSRGRSDGETESTEEPLNLR